MKSFCVTIQVELFLKPSNVFFLGFTPKNKYNLIITFRKYSLRGERVDSILLDFYFISLFIVSHYYFKCEWIGRKFGLTPDQLGENLRHVGHVQLFFLRVNCLVRWLSFICKQNSLLHSGSPYDLILKKRDFRASLIARSQLAIKFWKLLGIWWLCRLQEIRWFVSVLGRRSMREPN